MKNKLLFVAFDIIKFHIWVCLEMYFNSITSWVEFVKSRMLVLYFEYDTFFYAKCGISTFQLVDCIG